MSLINDALRKARATQPVAGRMAEGPALKPLSAPRTRRTPILTLALAIAVLALAGGLLWAWYHAEHGELVARANTGVNATTVSAATKATVTPAATPSTVVSPVPAPAPATVVSHGPVIMRGQIISQTPPVAPADGQADAEVHPPVVPAQAEIQPGPVRRAIVRLNPNTPKPASRTYKLEGIFYSPKGPSAVIDGDLVYVGSEVADGKVVAIDNESATILTTSGETNVLVLVR